MSTELERIRQEEKAIATAFQAWVETYEVTIPPPEYEEFETVDDAWWDESKKIWWPIIICLVLFASSRTGWGIYDVNVKEGFPKFLAVLVAIVGVAGIEGLLVMFGLHRPRQLEMSSVVEFLDKSASWLAVIIGMVVSAVSGFEISKHAADALGNIFGLSPGVILAYAMGVGMSFVLYGVAEFVGRRKWVGEHKPAIRKQKHREKMKEYRAERQEDWEKSAVYLNLVREREVRRKQAEFDIEKANYKRTGVLRAQRDAEIASYQKQQNASAPAKTFTEASIKGQSESNGSARRPRGFKTNLVKEYMDDHATPDNQPTISEIKNFAAQQGVSLSNGIISKARTEWYKEEDPFRK